MAAGGGEGAEGTEGGIRGALRQWVSDLGKTITTVIDWSGGMSVMFGRAMIRGPRRPLGLFDISYQVVQLGIRSIPLATLMSVFVGMILAWQFGEALTDFGAKNALGYATSLALVRELVPTILAVTVGTKMATGMTAELGSMKVTEQIDAISAPGADPIKKLVWPRLVAASVAMPLLVDEKGRADRIYELLMDSPHVEDVFISEEELAHILKRW